ncbi:hypothetical protein SAMN05421640_3658 [Ekhidna lutea]|uniref:Uncharacterized protein n=1 Tax=Ekhidna lutea TaxID=447679 RepID=A0A239M7N1_EKHLU|nr:hypothetical protein SAMN05421640_3658 [Ekhidna lutea]
MYQLFAIVGLVTNNFLLRGLTDLCDGFNIQEDRR